MTGFVHSEGTLSCSPPSPPKNSGYAVGLKSLNCIAPTGDKIQTFPHYLSSLARIWTCMQQKILTIPSWVLLHNKLSVPASPAVRYQHQQYNLNLWSNAGDLPLCRRPFSSSPRTWPAINMANLNPILVTVSSLFFQTSCLLATPVKVIDVGFNGWKPMESWHRNDKVPTPNDSWELPSREGRRRQWYKKLCNASSRRCNQRELGGSAAGKWRKAWRRSSGWGSKRRPTRRMETSAMRSHEGRSALGEELVFKDVSPPILSKQEVQHMKNFILNKIESLKQQSLPLFPTKLWQTCKKHKN